MNNQGMAAVQNASLSTADKIRYLDGLRGVAAIAVVVAHLINGFYPALYTGDPRQAHNAWEVWAAGSPFNLVMLGNCFVCIFFMLSGYVLTYSVLSKERQGQLAGLVIARYVRLTIPILIAGIVTYLILKAGAVSHMEAARTSNSYWWLLTLYQFEPDWMDMLKESLHGVYQFDTTYNQALWTMRIELLGSFMVFSILALCRTVRLRVAAYLAISIFFFSPYYFCFIAGMIFYDFRDWIMQSHMRNGSAGKITTAFLLLTGLFLGAYPYAYTVGTWYEGLAGLMVPITGDGAAVALHLAGAILFMLAVERSSTIKKMLCGRVIQFWGRNAFSIYLLHLILIVSVFSGVFTQVSAMLPYDAACLVAGLVYFLVLMGASSAMYHAVDRPSVRFSHFVGHAVEAGRDKAMSGLAVIYKRARLAW
jgi:peptidoglycan/LPS O-acetylase OafA/YrhL